MNKKMIVALAVIFISPAVFAQGIQTAHQQEAKILNTALLSVKNYLAEQKQAAQSEELIAKTRYVQPLRLATKQALSNLQANGKDISFAQLYKEVETLMANNLRARNNTKDLALESKNFLTLSTERYGMQAMVNSLKNSQEMKKANAQYKELLSAFFTIGSKLETRHVAFNPENASHIRLIMMQIDASRNAAKRAKVDAEKKAIQSRLNKQIEKFGVSR